MIAKRTAQLMANLMCLSVIQACAQTGPFDGRWKGRYETTWGGDCGGSPMELSIAGTRITGTLDLKQIGPRVSLSGRIDTQGTTEFTAQISNDEYFRFEGRFRDEKGLILTDPSEAKAGAALRGAWRKYIEVQQLRSQAGEVLGLSQKGSCAGVWEATQL